ncbi:MAG: PQQ-binding-like beta-propeller repeat protein [Verrucomicrobiales bacterium]|nr:PQQ-binding-like beta-propeller repeat protein [Verrucomicrobiales bacterium]
MKLPSIFCLLILAQAITSANDWPGWRGPNNNGVADPDQDPPVELGKPKWQRDIQGRGHGSVMVWKDRVWVQVADKTIQRQSLLSFDRDTGRPSTSTGIHTVGFNQKLNKKATWASNTPATDGERVYVNFLHGNTAKTTALDMSGNQVWQRDLCEYKVHQGYGSSPIIYKNLVIVSADNKLGGVVCGLDRKTGDVVWKADRAKEPNYPSPVVLNAAGKDQLFLTGTNKVTSYDPLTGKVNWEIDGATTECVTTTVTDGERIYSSGGYPKNHVAAIEADGSGKIAWETKDRVYVPSMLVKDGHLYAVMDSGVAICWDAKTGAEKWKARLGGNFSGSPTLVGDKIYAGNESGTVYVFSARPDKLEVLSEQKIADEIFSSPSICGGQIFLRVANYRGVTRSESIVCFSK